MRGSGGSEETEAKTNKQPFQGRLMRQVRKKEVYCYLILNQRFYL